MNKIATRASALLVASLFLVRADADPVKVRGRPTQAGTFHSRPTSKQIWSEKKFYLFGGIDLGYTSYTISNVTGDAKRSGLGVGVRALAAYYLSDWVLDGGLGFLYISSSGTNTVGNILKVNTRTTYLDVSPRYRINHNWQIGPELQYWVSSDNGLNADINSLVLNSSAWVGLQPVYEWMNEANKYRFGGRWLTNVSGSTRSVNQFQLFFQMGFSPGGGSNAEERSRFNEELKESDIEKVEAEPIDAAPIRQSPPDPVELNPDPEVMSTPGPIPTPTPKLESRPTKVLGD